MARIVLKTTIPYTPDDWHIGRFSLLAALLRARGHEVVCKDREEKDGRDVDLAAAARGDFDQVWLFGVDDGARLTDADIAAIDSFRARGGGLLITRDHQDLGASFHRLAAIGACQHFQTINPEAETERRQADDKGSPHISWPNYHSGRNGDAQLIVPGSPGHPLLLRESGGEIEFLPAHPHEGVVSAPLTLGAAAQVVARGVSRHTGVAFNLIVAVEGGAQSKGGRVVADSSFHHFCDCNWEPALGAPTFVDEPWGDEMVKKPMARADAEAYSANVAVWLR